jgi:uncharacterized protein YecT (DUF1311 family)
MKALPGFLVLLMLSASASPQESFQYKSCSSRAKTQAAMNVCASNEVTRADEELNRVYKKLLSNATKQPDAADKIKAAERAWVSYRDAFIEAMYPATNKQAEYGSIYPMEAALLRAKLTKRQVSALNELMRRYSGDEEKGSK